MSRRLPAGHDEPIRRDAGGAILCGARSKQHGGLCGQRALKGTRRCRFHGGRQAAKAARQREAEERIRGLLGESREVDPGVALLESVYLTAGFVERLTEALRAIQVDPEAAAEEFAPIFRLAEARGDTSTRKQTVATLAGMLDAERDRLARHAALAVQAGVAERQVALAERQGALIVGLIAAVLEDRRLGLTEQARALGRQIAAERLVLLAGEGA